MIESPPARSHHQILARTHVHGYEVEMAATDVSGLIEA